MDWPGNDTFDSWGPFANANGESSPEIVKRKEKTGRKKRQRYDKFYGEPPAKRSAPSIRLGAGFKWNLQTLANAADAVETGGKSPVSALNELGVKVHYTVLRQGGPAHCPSFTVAVTVADMTFEGWGHSKREARASAARACLAALLARAGRVLPAPSQNQDFTSDEPAKFPVSEFQCLETKMTTPSPPSPADTSNTIEEKNGTENGVAAPRPPTPSTSPATALFGSTIPPPANKSPINVLYENYSGLVFSCTFGDGSPLDASQAPLQLSHSMRFKVVCQIKDQKFEGYGSSKKLAKLAAARSALAVLDEGRADSQPASAPAGFLHQTLADHIGKLVNEKFNELMKNDLVHSKRKVLAGIVITTNNRIDDARVIAVTTGTKCVSGEHMSVTGRAVNDCHAEVAARRCLQRHLYAQLLMYANSSDPRASIPESDVEPALPSGYQMKADRQVHLYISTAPCGDGRIFSPHEQQDLEPDKHPNRLARGQLRTKIESGEGTIPVKNCNNVVQTWDGVMQGERLLTMSCSDKVARWCVSGLQGALLSRLIAPVYLHSLVLGSLLHPHHMYRAICGRIEAYISSLPPPFRLHRPLLARAASTEARTPARAPSFSVCWCATTPLPEVINATTGKLESGQPSLLCKQSMFARWQYLVKRLPQVPQDTEMDVEPATLPPCLQGLLYNDAKQLCPTYQLAKNRLIDAFEKAKLGRWIKKPIEQDQFVCEITTADPNALFAWAGVYLHAWDSMKNVVGRSGESGIEDGQNLIDCGQRLMGSRQHKPSFDSVNDNVEYDTNDSDWSGDSDNDINDNIYDSLIGDTVMVTNLNSNYKKDTIISDRKIISKSSINDRLKNDTEYKYHDSIDKINVCVTQGSDCNTAQITPISNLVFLNDNHSTKDNSNTKNYSSGVTKSLSNDSIINLVNKTRDIVSEASYSSYNQSLVKFSSLVNSNSNFSSRSGRGRGLLHKLLNNNTNVRSNFSVGNNSFDNSIINNDSNNTVNDNSSCGAVNNRNYIKDIKNVNPKIQETILSDEKMKYWKDFYKQRQAKRAENSPQSNKDIVNISNIANDTAVFEILHAKSDLHTPKKFNNNASNEDVELSKPNHYIDDNINNKAQINIENIKQYTEKVQNTYIHSHVKISPKFNKLNRLHDLNLKKCREIDKSDINIQSSDTKLSDVFGNLNINDKENNLNNNNSDSINDNNNENTTEINIGVKSKLLSRKLQLMNRKSLK